MSSFNTYFLVLLLASLVTPLHAQQATQDNPAADQQAGEQQQINFLTQPWGLRCRDFEQIGEVCSVSTSIIQEGKNDPWFVFGVRRLVKEGEQDALYLETPLWVDLASGVSFFVDSGASITYAYSACSVSGCHVFALPEGGAIESLIRGKKLSVTFTRYNGKPLTIELGLEGTAKAFKDFDNKINP